MSRYCIMIHNPRAEPCFATSGDGPIPRIGEHVRFRCIGDRWYRGDVINVVYLVAGCRTPTEVQVVVRLFDEDERRWRARE